MEYLPTVVLGTLGGMLARWYMLRRDYRQYPSYPQGWAIHLFMGFIGGLIGAVLVPAFLEKEFGAISFLLLAAAQFREVRNVERNTLGKMEATEMVKRGDGYIEGIARVFEARNYLAIWTALVVAITAQMLSFSPLWQLVGSITVGLLAAFILNKLMRGKHIGDIAQIELTSIHFEDSILVAADVHLMNVGRSEARQQYLKRALAAIIKPKTVAAKATLANIGQMQAIAHDVSSMIGVFMDVGEQEFNPVVRRHPASGNLVMVILPSEPNKEAFVKAISRVPVLEGAIRKPLQSKAGQMME